MVALQVSAPEPQGGGVVLVKIGQGKAFTEVLQSLDKDSSVRVLVVAGDSDSSWAIEDAQGTGLEGLAELRTARFPVIACIGGNCCGAGLGLAVACDMRFAAEGVELLAGGVAAKGVASGDCTTHVLPQLIGPGDAIVGLLSGDQRPAEKLPAGLVQRAFPKDELLSQTLTLAKKVAGAGPVAVSATKQMIHGLPRRTLAEAQATCTKFASATSAERDAGDAAKGKTASFADYDGAQPVAALATELFGPGAGPLPSELAPVEPAEPWTPGSSDLIKVENHDAGVVQLTIKGKDKGNPWGPELDTELFKALSSLDMEGTARVIVITGSGSYFAKEGEESAKLEAKKGHIRCFSDIRKMKVPVIACVNGACRGPGFSLALACDVRIVAQGAPIFPGFAHRGRIPEDECAYMLPQNVGAGGAHLMLLSGDPIPAEDVPKGFAQKIYKQGDVLKESLDFAKKLGVFSSLNSMAVIKWQAYALPMRSFDEATKLTGYITQTSLGQFNPDHDEGMRVFGTGMPPSFGPFHPEIPFVKVATDVLKMPIGPPAPYEAYPEYPKPPKDPLEFKCVLVEEQDDGVVLITLNKRTRMNAWGPDIDYEFFEVLDYYDSDPKTRVIVITGQGVFFCAGHDAEFTQDGENLATVRPKIGGLRDFHDIRKMRTPTIAIVNGAACGIGLSLALMCDVRFACPDAKFGVIFPQRGLVGEEGTAFLLPHLAGVGDAMYLLLTGDNIQAQDLPGGICQRIVPRKELLTEGLAYARTLARSASPTAMAVVKQQAFTLSLRPFPEALEISGKLAASSFGEENPDKAEATSAKEADRAPQFSLYNAALPFLRLARDIFGGLIERAFQPTKPIPKPEPKPVEKKAVKDEPKEKPKRPAPKAGATGPQLAVKAFTVSAKTGASVRKHPAEDAQELSTLDSGDTVYLQEESFDGWGKLAEEDGWVRRCALVDGSVSKYLELEEEGESLVLASEEPGTKAGARKFKVVFKGGVAVKSEPKAKAKVASQKKAGELVIAEAQTYDGWIRLARNQGWVLVVGGTTGRMLEIVA